MEWNVAFLQEIQEAYASLADLTMVLVDEEGKRITDVSFKDDFSRLIFKRHRAREKLVHVIEQLGTLTNAVLMDSVSGAKFILSPIRVSDKLTYFLFAGYIFDESSRSFVQKYMETIEEKTSNVACTLATVSESSEDEKRNKVDLVRKASDIMSDYLTMAEQKSQNKKKFRVIQQSLEKAREDGGIADTIMKDILSTNDQFDFIGLALEMKEGKGHYCVKFIEGEHADWMKDHSFVLGEGFLGHTIAIEQFQFWKNASLDPRHHLYTLKGMNIKNLFCIPVYGDHQIKGVYFGGSYETDLTEKEVREHAHLKASVLSIVMTAKSLRSDLQNHLMELSTFNEIFKVITSVEDIKRILYILVDISINVIRGPFSCIISKPADDQSKVEIVSRGLTAEEINDYGADAARRVSNRNVHDLDISHPEVHQTSWGEKVLEFPLVFNDHFYGLLCVGCHMKNDPENYESFLSSLAVAGSISMHLHHHDRSSLSSDYVFRMLRKILSQIGPEKYERTMRVKELTEDFTAHVDKSLTEILSQASLLVEYNGDIANELIRNEEVKSVLSEFFHREEQKAFSNKASEILALIYSYVTAGERMEEAAGMSLISQKLKNQFVDYISHQHVIESNIYLPAQEVAGKPAAGKAVRKDLKELTQLSTREADVLKLVLKGYSNMEIASELFISDHTVKNHMTKILQKLGVTDRSQAIAKVYKLGYSPAEE
ncbi:LuxR C-terminal-related transcriptional regulator [Rossellomorea oryzaecorticis]|uniref:LuxR C-terminal-related transcriptional regulator n=1 Tax=Rossellomorea oryzaecorticis TaxID=1396505 RepID=A0ABW8VLK8_9BACI